MKHILILGLLALLSFAARAQSATMAFEPTAWQAVLAKARQTHRPIFVYAYSRGCHFCKQMETTTFQDPAATGYYNATFVAYKVDMEADTAFARHYDINGFPTYLYLDERGSPLHRSSGAKQAAAFVADARAAFEPRMAFYTLQRQYQDGNRTPDLLYRYSQALEYSSQRQNPQSQVVAEYLATQSAEQLRNEHNLRYIFGYSTPQTDQYFLGHQPDFTPWFSTEERRKKADRILARRAYDAGRKTDGSAWLALRKLISTSFADTARANTIATINFLEARRDWIKYARATRQHSLQASPDYQTLYKSAKYVNFFGKDQPTAQRQEALAAILDVMPTVLKQERNYENLLLHAQLLHQAHRPEPARAAAQAALELAKQQKVPDEDAQELLQTLQSKTNK